MKQICGNCTHIDVCYVPRTTGCVAQCKHYSKRETQNADIANEGWFAALSTRKKAEFLSGMCVAAVRDFEWSETKRCCIDYWERWLKEEHK